jgi:hypothetical protein
MANELTVSGTFVYSKNNVTITESSGSVLVTVTGNGQNGRKGFSAIVADTAIPLGSVTTPCWFYMINNDPTNFVTVKRAVGGATIAKLKPGQFMLLPLDPGITAPSTAADTAPCSVDYAVLDI